MKTMDVSIRYACQDDMEAMVSLLQSLFVLVADALLSAVRTHSLQKKAALSPGELVRLYQHTAC